MSKTSALSAFAILGILSFGTAMAAPVSHVDFRGEAVAGRPIVQVDLKATDDEAGPSWTTPAYTTAQVAAARHGESALSAIDQEGNVAPAQGAAQQLATVPADNGQTDLNAYDNAA
jgi:hypothetical protein